LKKEYSPRFFQPYLRSENGQKLISGTQVGSGREGLNFQSIRSFKIFTPCLPEQTKIANFLTALDCKSIHNQTQLNALKQYKQGLLQQLFA
jgi:type I restriction enzyme S subunit